MGKIAFVFSGQGAQFPGMGQELAQGCAPAAQVFETLDGIRPGTSQQCFSGTAEELKETKNTQPCLFAVELAAAAALESQGIRADMAAGFSLGEIAALAYTQAADLETGFRLVCRRGELMQQAAEETPTAMAAVVKLTNEQVEELCAQFEGVYPVNYNCPGQVSVAGLQSQMAEFSAAVKAAGGRALPLKVKGGFHSPFMASASQGFAQVLAETALKAPAMPLYSNCTGEAYDGDPKDLLARQISSPVRWETIVRNMISAGADTFVELGPGQTLCGLIKKIDPAVRTFALGTPQDLEAICREVKGC
jgi:[acyl-carrier-protein] S-malonyltransferase